MPSNFHPQNLAETLPAIRANFPPELLARPQWVAWQYDGTRKIPKNPRTGGNAMANTPSTWSTFEEACSAALAKGLDGVGFMFHGDFFGIDLDDCRDAETGAVDDHAQAICKQFPSYAEITPSGRGLHILCKGTLPDGLSGKRKNKTEIYARGRFFTVTGDVFQHPQTLADCTFEIKDLLYEAAQPLRKTQLPAMQGIPDAEVLQLIGGSKDADVFSSLYAGHWSKADGGCKGFPSQSEADLAFCIIVARWSGCNPDQVDRLYRQSGLLRPKWDEMHGEETYGNITIAKAIAAAPDKPLLEPYGLIRQGAALNALSKALSALQYNPKTRALEACADKLSIRIDTREATSILKGLANGQASHTISYTVTRLLDVILIESARKGGGREVSFPLARYMQYCGLHDERAAGKQVRADLQILMGLSCTYVGNNRTGAAKDQRLLETGTIRRGRIEIAFGERFHLCFLKKNIVMPYPMALLRLNPRKERASYQLLRKMCEHKNMNYAKSNADIISVKALLAACSAIPSIEAVRGNDRHVRTRIIDAFIQSLDRLGEVVTYRFCHEGGRPLHPDEWPIAHYEDFTQLLIKTQWREYPVRKHRKAKEDR